MAVDTPIIDLEKVKATKQKLLDDAEVFEISDFFKLFGDSTRLKILLALENNKLAVSDLCNAIGITKSAASHQLNLLKANKLVKFERVGKNIFYLLDDEHVSSIIDTARAHLEEK